ITSHNEQISVPTFKDARRPSHEYTMEEANSSKNTGINTSPQFGVSEANRRRFQMELEFIQCLANPWTDLAQQGNFDDPTFLNYLRYLKYWQKP
ncbi:2308_t:CDS:2, partial [Paraglomus occultum]